MCTFLDSIVGMVERMVHIYTAIKNKDAKMWKPIYRYEHHKTIGQRMQEKKD